MASSVKIGIIARFARRLERYKAIIAARAKILLLLDTFSLPYFKNRLAGKIGDSRNFLKTLGQSYGLSNIKNLAGKIESFKIIAEDKFIKRFNVYEEKAIPDDIGSLPKVLRRIFHIEKKVDIGSSQCASNDNVVAFSIIGFDNFDCLFITILPPTGVVFRPVVVVG